MKYIFKKFRTDEDGAVTVDWVTLTAAVVILALAIITIFQDAAVNAMTTMWVDVDTAIDEI